MVLNEGEGPKFLMNRVGGTKELTNFEVLLKNDRAFLSQIVLGIQWEHPNLFRKKIWSQSDTLPKMTKIALRPWAKIQGFSNFRTSPRQHKTFLRQIVRTQRKGLRFSTSVDYFKFVKVSMEELRDLKVLKIVIFRVFEVVRNWSTFFLTTFDHFRDLKWITTDSNMTYLQF